MSQNFEPQQYAAPVPTNQYQPPMPYYAPQAAVPVKQPRAWLMPVLVAGALILGAALGSAGTAANAKAPEACLTALDLNEEVIGYASDAIGAISDRDFKASDAATEKIGDLSPKLKAAKAQCRK